MTRLPALALLALTACATTGETTYVAFDRCDPILYWRTGGVG